jgi:hypothetical protein
MSINAEAMAGTEPVHLQRGAQFRTAPGASNKNPEWSSASHEETDLGQARNRRTRSEFQFP